MKKETLLHIAALTLGLLLCCCGGGGGGGSGDGGQDDGSIDAQAYFLRDTTRSYTFRETVEASLDGRSATDEHTKTFTYDKVDSIPDEYGVSGAFQGPFTVETVSFDGETTMVTYTDATGRVIVTDDLAAFTRTTDNSTSGDNIYRVVLGDSYRSITTEKLFNSDTRAGEWGEVLGTSATTSTFTPEAIETVTVPAGQYRSLKAVISYTVSLTQADRTTTMEYSGQQWFSRDMGLVKGVLSYRMEQEGKVVEYTVTDELLSAE
jgi:hypothetical protein